MRKMPIKKSQREDEFSFLSNLDKVFWKDEGITKGELIHYYAEISDFILPHLKNRPESLKRFPDGIDSPYFFQKNLIDSPDWVETVKIQHRDKVVNYLLVQDFKSLLYEVNLGCIEIHPFLSHIPKLNYPDYAVFDLDPINVPFDAVVEVSLELYKHLKSLGIPSYPKTSGSRGMHIYIPLGALYTFEQAREFTHLIALNLHEATSKISSLERLPEKRNKRVYIDYLQNNPHQTIVAPYSVRAKRCAPVSTPLEWSEVRSGMNPLDYNLFNTKERLERKGDIMKPLLHQKIDIGEILQQI